MEFLEKLIDRPLSARPLKAGSLSGLAAEARREECDQYGTDFDTEESAFAASFLSRALRAADFIVTAIEEDQAVLAFLNGASRDVLLYETLHYCLHGISNELRRIMPEVVGSNVYLSDLAFIAAGQLGRQHLGQFDVSRHRLERAKNYMRLVGNPKHMTEYLIGILLCARDRTGIEQFDTPPPERDSDFAIQVSLSGIVHQAAVVSILDGAEKLAARSSKPDQPGQPH
jgi:hypothetical protein